ncbi:hypothetical protein Tco_0200965 [Tanacetum coccineum]
MGDEKPIRTLGDYSKPSHEGYRNTIELPVGNNVVPLRSDTIRLVQNGCSFHGLRSEDPNQHLKDFLKLVDSLDFDGANRERTCLRRTAKLQNDILIFQQHQGESLSEAWTRFKDSLQKVPHHGIDIWLQIQIFYDRIDQTLKRTVDCAARGRLRKISAIKARDTIEELARYEDERWNDPVVLEKESLNYENPELEQLLGIMEYKFGTLMEEEITLMGRSESIFGMSSNLMHQLPPQPSRQEAFEDLVMNFILDQEERVKQLEEYMGVIGSDFMLLSLEVVEKLKEEIRIKKNKFSKIKKIMRYPDTEDLEPITENASLQSSPQVLSSFKENTPLVTYPDEVEETIGLNTCSHDLSFSSREIPSVDEPEPQISPNFSPLDVNLGVKRGTDLPIKPHSPDCFRMKVVDK